MTQTKLQICSLKNNFEKNNRLEKNLDLNCTYVQDVKLLYLRRNFFSGPGKGVLCSVVTIKYAIIKKVFSGR